MSTSADFQCISIYRCFGSKALILPVQRSRATDAMFQNCSNRHLKDAEKTHVGDGIRLKFPLCQKLWTGLSENGLPAVRIVLELVQIMQKNNMILLCCADLNLRGESAGNYFFERIGPVSLELACIQLIGWNTMRIVQLPEDERPGVERVLRANWDSGVTRFAGLYKLGGRPWCSGETSRDKSNVNSKKLMIGILSCMYHNGWSRVLAFDCYLRRDVDSLLFYRMNSGKENPTPEFCAIALERSHKIRLIGATDEPTHMAFRAAVRKGWTNGVQSLHAIAQDNLQIKVHGTPWQATTTEENLASARLILSVLQSLWDLNWRWHCAIHMSTSISDKSTFFLRRGDSHDGFGGGHLVLVQPKGHGKVNIVSIPAHLMKTLVEILNHVQWGVPLSRIQVHGGDAITLHFLCRDLHFAHTTDAHIRTVRVYMKLFEAISSLQEGASMLGCADISANCTDDDPVDTDVFFFWFPGPEQVGAMQDNDLEWSC